LFDLFDIYDLFVKDVNAIVDRSRVTDRILESTGDGVGLLPVNVTTDLESDLIQGLLSCDLEQISAIHNQYDRYFDLIFSNAGTNVADRPFLDLIVITGFTNCQ
jgi:hypothetical protein